jgi:hypothetical protein
MGNKELKLIAISYKKSESEKNGVDERYILIFQQGEDVIKKRIDANEFSKADWEMGHYYKISMPDSEDLVAEKNTTLDALVKHK